MLNMMVLMQSCGNYPRAHILVSDYHTVDSAILVGGEAESVLTAFTNVARAPLYGTFLSWRGSPCEPACIGVRPARLD